MVSDPLAKLRSASDIPKRDEETLREYVRRVGEVAGIPRETVEDSIEYLARWQYAREPPDDDGAFRAFLAEFDGEEHGLEDLVDSEETVEIDAPDLEPVPELQPLRAERRETRSDFKSGLQGSEPRRLLVRFLVTVATAPVIGWLIGRVWVPGIPIYDRGLELVVALLGLATEPAIELVSVFGLGLYAGLLALLLLDVTKRVQGMLLLLATLLVLGVTAAMGVFLPNLELTWLNVVAGVGGLLVGLLVEFDQLLRIDRAASRVRRPTLDDGTVPEFRTAAYLLFGVVALLIVASLGQAVTADIVRVWDVAAAGAFLVTGYQFVQYESETGYMILGPARAGKSMLTLGLCLELVTADGPRPNPNDYLQRGLERVSNLVPGEERWPIPSTLPDELSVASFEVIVGYYFPRRLELTALDYAGQHLERVAQLFEQGETSEDEGVPGEVAELIAEGDTLLVLLDVERLEYPGKFREDVAADESISWGLNQYATILQNHDPEDVVVVATKCDILIDRGHVDAPAVGGSYDDFRAAVTEYLASRPDVRELLDMVGESTIHPVYYATKRRGEDEYVPRLDEQGNLMPVGYGQLLAELRRRQ